MVPISRLEGEVELLELAEGLALSLTKRNAYRLKTGYGKRSLPGKKLPGFEEIVQLIEVPLELSAHCIGHAFPELMIKQ